MLGACIATAGLRITSIVDVDPQEANPMERQYAEVVGVLRTGWPISIRRGSFLSLPCSKIQTSQR